MPIKNQLFLFLILICSIQLVGQVVIKGRTNYKTDLKSEAQWLEQKEEQEIKPPTLSFNEAWEVDLHLHELLDSFEQKSDHEKLKFQLNYFKKCMEAAIINRIQKVIFITSSGPTIKIKNQIQIPDFLHL